MILSKTEGVGETQASVIHNKRGFSVQEVSQESSLSRAFIRQKIKKGELKATYFGRRVVVLLEDLEAFLKNGSK